MNIAENQHVFEPILAPLLVSASAFEYFWIFEGAKKDIPQRDIREIVGVMTELMMHAMRFRSLENEANPGGRFDIPMIEERSHCNQDGVITSGANAGAKQWIQNQAAQNGIE